jgi:hypothetical protein
VRIPKRRIAVQKRIIHTPGTSLDFKPGFFTRWSTTSEREREGETLRLRRVIVLYGA